MNHPVTIPMPISLCQHCRCRFGQHRWGTLSCPNPHWKPGNGKSNWLQTSYEPRKTFLETP